MRRVLVLAIIVFLIAPPRLDLSSVAQDVSQEESGPNSAAALQIQEKLEGEFDAEKIVAANSWVASIGVVDWLGPLAPVAMSPFFGIACLSGLSLWGPDWVTDNALLGSTGPLQNEWLFGIFLVLTAVTSAPRFTKVSKPFAQAVDQLETYAVIVILLAIKLTAAMESGDEQPAAVVQLGVLQFTLDTLLAIAMVINVLVINSVKFFFEFLVWLTPVPFLDAIFELCNKTLCAALMVVYALSPTLATVINLCILVFAAILFRWISRRIRFYRTMVLDPILSRVWSKYGQFKRPELIVFPKGEIGPFKAKSRLKFKRNETDNGWVLEEGLWWMPAKHFELAEDCQPKIHCGWVMNAVKIEATESPNELTFSRRYDTQALARLAQQLDLSMPVEPEAESEAHSIDQLAGEFA